MQTSLKVLKKQCQADGRQLPEHRNQHDLVKFSTNVDGWHTVTIPTANYQGKGYNM
jgi:hypothetical protein